MRKRLISLAEQGIPDIKESIKESREYQSHMAQTQSSGISFPLKKLTGAMAVLVIMLGGFLFFSQPQPETSSSSLYMEVNPSFELKVKDDDTIETFIAHNDDAKTLNGSDIEGQPFETGIENLLVDAIEKGLIDPDQSSILYDVLSEDESIESRHLSMVESVLESIKDDHMPGVHIARGIGGPPSQNEQDIVQKHDIGHMHARIIGQILLEDEDAVIEDYLDKSIPELMDILGDDFHHGPNGPNHRPFDDNGPPMNGGPRHE